MTLRNSPLAIEALTYTAEPFREAFGALAGALGGVIAAGDFLTVQHGGGANMSVDVPAGGAFVVGSSNAVNQGSYFMRNDGVINLAIGASSGSQTRHDIVALTVNDATYAGATNSGVLAVVAGTFGGGLPSLPASSLALTDVLVPISATTIVTADLTDVRVYASGLTQNPTARMYSNSVQSLASGGTTGLTGLVVDTLRGGFVQIGGSNGGVVIPITGWYMADCLVTISSPTQNLLLDGSIWVNSSAVRSFFSNTLASFGNVSGGGADLLPLNAGDVLQMVVTQANGASASFNTVPGYNTTFFSVHLVSL